MISIFVTTHLERMCARGIRICNIGRAHDAPSGMKCRMPTNYRYVGMYHAAGCAAVAKWHGEKTLRALPFSRIRLVGGYGS